VAQQNFSETGIAVEVGVFTGKFSAKNLLHWKGHYFQIDAWKYRPGDPTDKNYKGVDANLKHKTASWDAVKPFHNRVTQIQALSYDAAATFKNESIDWIYIDALHTEEALLKDLNAWYPKVRPGGLISGDDYGTRKNSRLMTSERWAKKFGAVAKIHNWGVINALDNFAAANKLIVHVTWQHDCYFVPAWYMIKPWKLSD